MIATVKSGLATASLVGGNDNLEAGSFEHTNRVEPNARIKLIDEAGNEESDSANHARSVAEIEIQVAGQGPPKNSFAELAGPLR